jgi:hypothetical protein
MTTVRILGSRAREQVPGTSITLLAPGFRGSLTQLAPGVAMHAAPDLPFAEAAAGADVMLAAQLALQLEARSEGGSPLRQRSAVATHPRVIVPRRPGVAYALLQTDEAGHSSFLPPLAGDDSEAVFRLDVSSTGSTRRTLRVLMWPGLSAGGPGSLAVAARWEQLRRPNQLAQRSLHRQWQPPNWPSLATGPVLLLLPDTFSTPQATFTDWLEQDAFVRVANHYEGRCLACSHPTLSASIDDNLEWLVGMLAALPGPFDIVAHGRGGLLARSLAIDGRLPLRRVCQVGTPNQGTLLARESHLSRFLDAHVAMLALASKAVAQGALEGALCVARFLAQGLRAGLPGIETLTPDHVPLRGVAHFPPPGLQWYTVGAEFQRPPGHGCETSDTDDFHGEPNDLVVPERGCHEPGVPVTDSLRLRDVHHHGYFTSPELQARLTRWLL